jgi:prepilin-type N-terminal cleavage/methylation domain-containing protein
MWATPRAHWFRPLRRPRGAGSLPVSERGFTIVELLIVIVVIGILAAITIVAYNGVSQRASAAASQSAAEQAAKKVLTYMVLNSDQVPTDLVTAGVPSNGNTAFQYSSNPTSSPQTFCITATTGSKSYFVNNSTQTTPAAGSCPLTNLLLNPSFETDSANWDYRWYGANGGSGNNTRPTTGGAQGGSYLRKTWTTSGAGQDVGFSTNAIPSRLSVQSGLQYYVSGYLRTNRSGFIPYIWVCWYDASGVQLNNGNCVAANSAQVLPTNSWTRISGTLTSPMGATQAYLVFSNVADSANWIAGDTLDFDGAMLVQTTSTSVNYADGNSTNWSWNGTPNESTSTGPPQ